MKSKSNNKNNTSPANEIAVIGMGCWYPGANNISTLWENILGAKQQFRRMPDVRLPIAEYFDPNKLTPDKTYGSQAAVIDGYEFDWATKRIPKSAYESCDIVHWFALDVALQTLADAGYDAARLPKATTQVIIGNTLTGEFTRSNTLRLRWPYVQKTLITTALDLGYSAEDAHHFATAMESRFKSVFAPVNEDTLAGGLANTIAGRICNYLDLNGGGFTVDGACSSSLIAIHTAATNLMNGSCDFVLAGGVDVSLDPFEIIGFAKTGALTPSKMAVYDKRGNGFIPGEGAGFVALKRLADAKRDGDYIYSVLDGWGMSSDGKGGITAPSVKGQALALKRAYEMAGANAKDITFIEGHGTGTAVGDKTELLGIAKAFTDIGGASSRVCGVTSFKSIVGHTKAAAGIGAFIKTTLSLNQRVIPPTAGCEIPHEVFSDQVHALYPVLRGKSLPPNAKMRAGVSAMGFGGINLHVTLRPGDPAKAGLTPAIGVSAALSSKQDSEIFFIEADSQSALKEKVTQLLITSHGISVAQVVDLAAHLATKSRQEKYRAAIIARDPAELEQRLNILLTWLSSPLEHDYREDKEGVFLGLVSQVPKLGFVFPGQGSQRLNAGRNLIKRFSWANDLIQQVDSWARDQGTNGLEKTLFPDLDIHPLSVERDGLNDALTQTDMAQPAIVASSLLWLEFFNRLGIKGQVFMGHSLGELTAFYASGAFNAETLVKLACIRGQLMAAPSEGAVGAMLSLATSPKSCEELIKLVDRPAELVIANLNSSTQTIVSGAQASIKQLEGLAQHQRIQATQLKVSQAFHSPMVAHAAAKLADLAPLPTVANENFGTLISSATAGIVSADLDLKQHFARQITQPVNFIGAMQLMGQHCDFALEVGPGAVLSNLAAQIESSPILVPVEQRAETWIDCNHALAKLFVRGVEFDKGMLFRERLISPFKAAKDLQFIVNPCERTQQPSSSHQAIASEQKFDVKKINGISDSYWNARGDFIRAVIAADQSYLGSSIDSSIPALTQVRNSQVQVIGPSVKQAVPYESSPEKALLTLVADFTGFRAETLSLDMRLVDDLNLDSIKTVDLINSIVNMFALAPIDSVEYTNARLTDFLILLPVVTRDVKRDVKSVQSAILQIVAETTGFSADQLHPDQKLLDDLNLDSIKAGDLVSRVKSQLQIPGELTVLNLMEISIRGLAEQLVLLLPDMPAATTQASPRSAYDLVMSVTAALTGFDASHIQPQFGLTDDLNLDSIKVASLLSRVVEAAGLSLDVVGQLDTVINGQSRLQDLIDVMQHKIGLVSAVQTAPVRQVSKDSWVRSFAMKLIANELPAAHYSKAELSRHTLGVLCLSEDQAAGFDLTAALITKGVQASLHFHDESNLLSNTHTENWVVIAGQSANQHSDLMRAVELRQVAAMLSAGANSRSLSFVQVQGLIDGVQGDYKSAATSAFAASLHLERPKLKVRVLDYAQVPTSVKLAEDVISELYSEGHYQLVHFSTAERFQQVAVVVEPADCEPRNLSIGSDDWILVTGGAKGITAACGLALAQVSKSKMLLIGSSPFDAQKDKDSEIAKTLATYREAGLIAEYLSCNLADAMSLNDALQQFETTHGAITAVIHGAGTNQPRRAETVSAMQAAAEIAPKLNGALNLCSYFSKKPPKLFLALTSIIGVTGMAGNSWYAYSNEAVNLCLQRFNNLHPSCEIASLAYSVWDEVGMGVRMGSVNYLAKMGIDAIPPQLAIKTFLMACYKKLPSSQIVISSRLGTLDTWAQSTLVVPDASRYLGAVQNFTSGVERVSQVLLNLADDLYLKDHFYQGVYLFPTVMGLEAMAQNVAALLGLKQLPALSLHNISLERPIIVDAQKGANIRIQVLARPREKQGDSIWVDAAIFTEHTQYHRPHFAASFNIADMEFDNVVLNDWPSEQVVIDPSEELYGNLLFQGPLFQHLDSVWQMSEQIADFCVSRFPAKFFSSNFNQALILGDPGYRDVLLQSAQLCEKDTYLPVNIARLDIRHTTSSDPAIFKARIRVVERPEQHLVCNLNVFSETGEVIESLSGYRLKRMRQNPGAAEPSDWVNPTDRDLKQLREELSKACNLFELNTPTVHLHFLPKLSSLERTMRRVMELPLITELVTDAMSITRTENDQLAKMEVHWTDDGRPYITGMDQELDISLSHNSSHCLLVAGTNLQGCDIEDITRRTVHEWKGLLGEKNETLLNSLQAMGDDLDTAGTRIWSLMESAKKSLGDGNGVTFVIKREGEQVLFDAEFQGRHALILTLPMQFTRPGRKLIAMVVETTEEKISPDPQLLTAPAASLLYDDMKKGPNGQFKPCFRFRVTFKDANSLSSGITFVGSSRVDLQACKLEYSIVSPK